MKEDLLIQPFNDYLLVTVESYIQPRELDRYGCVLTVQTLEDTSNVAITKSAWNSKMRDVLDIKERALMPTSRAPGKTSWRK